MKELAKFNVADKREVTFLDGRTSARIEFNPPIDKLKDGVTYMVEVDAGTAIVYKPDPCGNAPAATENAGAMFPFMTAECKPKPPPQAIPDESIPSPDFETAKERVWHIKFNKKIVRPTESAFIKILELPSKKLLAKYDASKAGQVEFPSDDPTILRFDKPAGIEDGMKFTLELGPGVVMAVNAQPCRSEMNNLVGGVAMKPNPPTSWGFKSPPPPEPYVDCGDYSMTFHVPHKYVDDMAPELLHLHDPSCTAKSRNSKFMSVTTFFDECGTKSKVRLSHMLNNR
ncbi:uncharacterized protein LOC117109113 [Anneissia japonica]|uniref:uncharacterized protein LOC117109113 n=1 Tax=Anneissia japonica TaxID=1529436 RepID=UPI001425B944|nr:uncharacterized protein LOC117109113 [Anneissia japonica]